jgi:hypothetical protein
MSDKRIQFSNIVRNQLPSYVKEEFPLVSEFLSQYYLSQEFQGAPIDLIQNIDNYIKVDQITSQAESAILFGDISSFDSTIFVDGTNGFPEKYGLLKIDDEVITYTNTTENKLIATANISVGSTICYYSGLSSDYIGRKIILEDNKILDENDKILVDIIITSVENDYFTTSKVGIASTSVYGYKENNNYKFQTTNSILLGCIRGFSGISSYISSNQPDQLVFSKTESTEHSSGSTIVNLSSLFLKEFLLKIKHQLTPGFESREFTEELNDSLFIKQSKDFYRSKGTDQSFEILFKSLYGENVSIIRPKEYLFRPSDAQFQITNDLVVESIEGNPENLENSTLLQDEVLNFTKAYAPSLKLKK